MNHPKVSIIILNWNGLSDTIECLESLKKINYSNYNVVLIDNGSSGNDAQVLKQKYGDYIFLIENDKNYGYTGGVNIGIKYTLSNLQSDYILLLNNDTVVDPEFLIKMVEVLESDKSIGITGPIVYYYDDPGHIQTMGERLKITTWDIFCIGSKDIDFNTIIDQCEVDFFTCCFLVRIEVVKKIGLLNEDYFCYWEDIDYCMRAKEAGYKVVCSPHSRIWHKMRMKKKLLDKPLTDDKRGASVNYYVYRNAIIFIRHHYNRKRRMLYYCFLFGYQFWLIGLAYLIFYRDTKRFMGMFYGIRDGLLGKSGPRVQSFY
jgi:GT2 family glycosyltransferase